jgi:hypothetical protein
MKIGILSDTHDNITLVRKAVSVFNSAEVGVTIHCGDYCAPFILKELANLKCILHGVFGNVDGEIHYMTKLAITDLKNIKLYGILGEITVENLRIAFTHNDIFAQALFDTNKYDCIFYGHTHICKIEYKDGKAFINPGEFAGLKSKPSVVIFDTDTKKADLIWL